MADHVYIRQRLVHEILELLQHHNITDICLAAISGAFNCSNKIFVITYHIQLKVETGYENMKQVLYGNVHLDDCIISEVRLSHSMAN